MISCAEATRRLWEYLDETLDEGGKERLEEHLARCRSCCGELEFAKELRAFLARSVVDDVPPEVLRRLYRTLEELDR